MKQQHLCQTHSKINESDNKTTINNNNDNTTKTTDLPPPPPPSPKREQPPPKSVMYMKDGALISTPSSNAQNRSGGGKKPKRRKKYYLQQRHIKPRDPLDLSHVGIPKKALRQYSIPLGQHHCKESIKMDQLDSDVHMQPVSISSEASSTCDLIGGLKLDAGERAQGTFGDLQPYVFYYSYFSVYLCI